MKILKIEELKTALKGKSLRYLTGWNFTVVIYHVKSVRHSQQHKGYYDLILLNPQGQETEILFSDFGIHQLAQFGKHEVQCEIDHCPYRDRYEILSN